MAELPDPTEAVRHRIRKAWERRRAESAGRSEAFVNSYGPSVFTVMPREVVLNHRELHVIPAHDDQPERPRNPQAVKIRLIQPR